jgi:thioesterase domain-containing protein
MGVKVISTMLEQSAEFMPINDGRLTAMGAYTRLVAESTVTAIRAPTLCVRATRPMFEQSTDDNWRASWPLPHTAVDVPGNHWTMMDGQAESTAAAVEDWLIAGSGRVS